MGHAPPHDGPHHPAALDLEALPLHALVYASYLHLVGTEGTRASTPDAGTSHPARTVKGGGPLGAAEAMALSLYGIGGFPRPELPQKCAAYERQCAAPLPTGCASLAEEWEADGKLQVWEHSVASVSGVPNTLGAEDPPPELLEARARQLLSLAELLQFDAPPSMQAPDAPTPASMTSFRRVASAGWHGKRVHMACEAVRIELQHDNRAIVELRLGAIRRGGADAASGSSGGASPRYLSDGHHTAPRGLRAPPVGSPSHGVELRYEKPSRGFKKLQLDVGSLTVIDLCEPESTPQVPAQSPPPASSTPPRSRLRELIAPCASLPTCGAFAPADATRRHSARANQAPMVSIMQLIRTQPPGYYLEDQGPAGERAREVSVRVHGLAFVTIADTLRDLAGWAAESADGALSLEKASRSRNHRSSSVRRGNDDARQKAVADEHKVRSQLYDELYPERALHPNRPAASLQMGGARARVSVWLDDVHLVCPCTPPPDGAPRAQQAFCIGIRSGSLGAKPTASTGSRSEMTEGSGGSGVGGGSHTWNDGQGDALLQLTSDSASENARLAVTLHMLTCCVDMEADGLVELDHARLLLPPMPIVCIHTSYLKGRVSATPTQLMRSASNASIGDPSEAQSLQQAAQAAVDGGGDADTSVDGLYVRQWLHINCPHTSTSSMRADGWSHQHQQPSSPLSARSAAQFSVDASDVEIIRQAIASLTSSEGAGGSLPPSPPAEDGASRTRRLSKRRSLQAVCLARLDELTAAALLASFKMQVRVHELHLAVGGGGGQKPLLSFSIHTIVHEHTVTVRLSPAAARELHNPVSILQHGKDASVRHVGRLAVSASYLNLRLNQLEPLLEPYDAHFFVVSPQNVAVTTAKLTSSRVLHLNASMALLRTLRELQERHHDVASEGERSGFDASSRDSRTQLYVEDLASGHIGVAEHDGHAQLPLHDSQPPALSVRLVEAHGSGEGQMSGDARGRRVASQRPLLWTPPLSIALTDSRVTCHRVWPCRSGVCPHAVVIAEVGATRAAGRKVILRSNVTIRNQLQCAVALLFEPLAAIEDDAMARRDGQRWLAAGASYHVPLRLTSGHRLYVRPLSGQHNKREGEAGDDAHEGMQTMTATGDGFYDWALAQPPRPTAADAFIEDLARLGVADDGVEAGGHGPTALVCVQRHSRRHLHAVWGAINDHMLSVLPKFTIENRLPVGIQFCLCAEGRASSSSGFLGVGATEHRNLGFLHGWGRTPSVQLPGEGSASESAPASEAPTPVADEGETATSDEWLVDALPIGAHSEIFQPFLLDQSRTVTLQLRYVEDALESGSEYAAEHAHDATTLRAAATEAALQSRAPWSSKKPLTLLSFERNPSAHRGMQERIHFTLNSQMQAWAQMTHGGPNESLRVVSVPKSSAPSPSCDRIP